jgi:hypothetical protein
VILRVLVSLALLSAVAFAGDIDLWVDDSSGEIGLVDVTPGPNLGNVTLIGNSGIVLTDIAFDPSGNLFGIGPLAANAPYYLYSLSTTTGLATTIGAFNPTINSVSCSTGQCGPNSLVFSSNDTLYTATDTLFTINPTTAADTAVGPLGGGFVSGGDLAFIDGTLYLATANDDLVSVNTTTGAATLVGAIGVPSVFGFASPDDKTLYGVAGTSVYTVNTTTGAATFLANYGGQGLGQAYGEAFYTEAMATPEPSTLVLFGAGLLLISLRGWKRHA